MKPIDFINKFKPTVLALSKKYNVPASVLLAQAAIESAWLTSKFSQQYNNLTGMKATGGTIPNVWDGSKSVQDTTEEYTPGTISKIKSAFRVYKNFDQSLEDLAHRHAVRFKLNNNDKDINKFINAVIKSGYATGTGYHNLLNTIIDQYKLYDLDRGNKFSKTILAKPTAGTNTTTEIKTPQTAGAKKK